MSKLTVVMYHYVRDLQNSRFPKIMGLPLASFQEQLQLFKREYNPVTMRQIMDYVNHGEMLPERAIYLTFDDGYLEHFTNCFPLLHDFKIEGAFYPPVLPVRDRVLLDVNRVHFLLATTQCDILADYIDRAVDNAPAELHLKSVEQYRQEWAKANRFDTSEVIYVKRMLQVALPEEFRNKLSSELFSQYVSIDEGAFASELYCDCQQLRLMKSCGMHIGSHGSTHRFLSSLSRQEQSEELDTSLEFLGGLGCNLDEGWSIAFPFGDYSDQTLELVRQKGGTIGFSTRVDIADLAIDGSLELPRLDTNDFR